MSQLAKDLSNNDYDYWRNLQSEMDRKTLDSLSVLHDLFTSNQICIQAYLTSLRALNIALRGLVDEDVIQTIDLEINSLEKVGRALPFIAFDEIKPLE